MKPTKENPALKKVTISRINKEEKETKYGTSLKIGLQTKEADGVWVNGLAKLDSEAANWKKDDVIEILCWKDDKWGLQFKVKPDKITRQEFNDLLARVEALESKLNTDKIVETFDGEVVEDKLPF